MTDGGVEAEKAALARVQEGLFHLRLGLAPFVATQMLRVYGKDWSRHARRVAGAGAADGLDVYGLLKTILDQWRSVFEALFTPAEGHRFRSFVSVALDGRNFAAHPSRSIEDSEALRYLDAFCQLAMMARGPAGEIGELKRIYLAQRHGGVRAPAVPVVAAPAPAAVVAAPVAHAVQTRVRDVRGGSVEALVLDFVGTHPDHDDDELSKLLGILPRQRINIAARKLAAQGLLQRFVGRDGKIVNRAVGDGAAARSALARAVPDERSAKLSHGAYWIYENWPTRRATLHRADCRHCNSGAGSHPDSSGNNGRWHGPFGDLDSAHAALTSFQNLETRVCMKCRG